MVASESSAIDILGFDFVRDIQPGEGIYIEENGNYVTKRCAPAAEHTPCIFEHVYLGARRLDHGRDLVYKARLRMGEKLAKHILARYPDGKHDIGRGHPYSGIEPDLGDSVGLRARRQVPRRVRQEPLHRPNLHHAGPGPAAKSVQQKLNAIELEFQGKNVLLVEDSIVRGTTTGQIVRQARRAGARKVFMAVAAPPVRYPNVYGIDMPSSHEFVAYNRTEEQIGEAIGVDWLVYQSIEDLVGAAAEGNSRLQRFECSVFDGDYVTGDIDEGLSGSPVAIAQRQREAT